MKRHFANFMYHLKKISIILLIIVIIFQVDTFVLASDYSTSEIKIEKILDQNNFVRQQLIGARLEMSGKTQKIPILLYHHILPKDDMANYGWNNNMSVVSVQNFNEQMKWLYDNHCYTATLPELEAFLDGKINLPKDTVIITFDDGYLSNAVYAYPIMKKYSFKGTIFMIGNAALKPQIEYSPKGLQFMSISTLSEYSDVFDYGCHTYNMHNMSNGLTMLEILKDQQVKEDLLKNKKLFNSKYIAYPHGKYKKSTLPILKELGYTLGFTVKYGYADRNSNKYEIPRIIIYPDTNLESFINQVRNK